MINITVISELRMILHRECAHDSEVDVAIAKNNKHHINTNSSVTRFGFKKKNIIKGKKITFGQAYILINA